MPKSAPDISIGLGENDSGYEKTEGDDQKRK